MDYYEKAYNEALERAKAEAIDGYLDAVALETIFPELKESEDERIRKDIIAFLQSMNRYCNPTQDWDLRNRWLPYLEKQKEQKPGDEDRYMEGYMNGINDALKEQKPTNSEKPKEWSEEDIDMFGSILSTLSVYSYNPNTPKEERERCKKDIAWFNELYHKGCPQPHWKPSEHQLEVLKLVAEKDGTCLMGLYNDLKKL